MGGAFDITRRVRPKASTPRKTNNATGLLIIIFLAVLFLGLTSNKIFESQPQNKQQVLNNKDEDTLPIQNPKTNKKTNLKVDILGNSNISQIIKSKLQDLGYKSLAVKPLDNSLESNKIYYSAGQEDQAKELLNDLKNFNLKIEPLSSLKENELIINLDFNDR